MGLEIRTRKRVDILDIGKPSSFVRETEWGWTRAYTKSEASDGTCELCVFGPSQTHTPTPEGKRCSECSVRFGTYEVYFRKKIR